jgi:hypothetical protein
LLQGKFGNSVFWCSFAYALFGDGCVVPFARAVRISLIFGPVAVCFAAGRGSPQAVRAVATNVPAMLSGRATPARNDGAFAC